MKKIAWLFSLSFFIVATTLPRSVSAGSAILYLTPASTNLTKGSILSIQIKENSGTEIVNAVQANLSYPTNMLDFVSTENTAAFSIVAENYTKPGSIRIARGAMPSVSGSQTIATVKFKVKKDTGTATIQFTSGSAVAKDNGMGTDILSGTAGGYYTMGTSSPVATSTTAASSSTPPPAPTTDSVTVAGETVSVTGSQPITTEQNEPLTLTGVTIPNGLVTIYVYSEPKKYHTVADNNGNWSYTVADAGPGQHRVEIEVTDPITQKTSERKKILDFQVVASAATPASLLTDKTVPLWYLLVAAVAAFAAGVGGYRLVNKRRLTTESGSQKDQPPDQSPTTETS